MAQGVLRAMTVAKMKTMATLVTAGQQPLVRLWDVATGKPVHNWPAHTQSITALSFTPNGAALISGSHDGSIQLGDAKTGRHLLLHDDGTVFITEEET